MAATGVTAAIGAMPATMAVVMAEVGDVAMGAGSMDAAMLVITAEEVMGADSPVAVDTMAAVP